MIPPQSATAVGPAAHAHALAGHASDTTAVAIEQSLQTAAICRSAKIGRVFVGETVRHHPPARIAAVGVDTDGYDRN
jgi:hypothetical protein